MAVDNSVTVAGDSLSFSLSCGTIEQRVRELFKRALNGDRVSVAFCNSYSVYVASNRSDFHHALRSFDYVFPDGAPVAALARLHGASNQRRIAGPDFMTEFLTFQNDSYSPQAESDVTHFVFGGSVQAVHGLATWFEQRFPNVPVVGCLSPKYGDWSDEESMEYVRFINLCKPRVVWVGLGCPKQELWIATYGKFVNSVVLGVGAAFDFNSGLVPRAPEFFRGFGLESLYRFFVEPRRLFRRTFFGNFYFVRYFLIPVFFFGGVRNGR